MLGVDNAMGKTVDLLKLEASSKWWYIESFHLWEYWRPFSYRDGQIKSMCVMQ